MGRYWARHRLLLTILICVVMALITSYLFVYPSIIALAKNYNTQSVYKNCDIDFIVPEPSFDQVNNLVGTHGINRVFPFFMTKTQVNVKGSSRTSTVLLSDHIQEIDDTMYNSSRLIEKSDVEYDHPVLVDWQFCRDTSAAIGDTVVIAINGENVEFTVCGIYETNSIYDGGAILAIINNEQMDAIMQQSSNNGYSGMYVIASDYSICKNYLTTEYRPLGRLKDRERFSNDEQYQVHYNAIMSSGYANEITDFHVRVSSETESHSFLMTLIGALLGLTIIIVYNSIMSRRGCEKTYFQKQCIPRGKRVRQYYVISFVFELLFFIVFYFFFLYFEIKLSSDYIPVTVIGFSTLLVPLAFIIAEILCLVLNNSMISKTIKRAETGEKSTQ